MSTEFKEKLRSLNFAPTKSPQTLMERRWDKDMPAYDRLRRNGLQPRQIDGCAKLEQTAESQLEINMGHLLPKKSLPAVVEGMEAAREIREERGIWSQS